jgi:hypothetical protein
LERAIERLEKLEGLEFEGQDFEAGRIPPTLMVNPQGKIRVTNARVTAVAPDRITVEVWRLSFVAHRTAETKVFASRRAEFAFGDIAVGDTVAILGRLDAEQTALIHAEVIHNFAQVLREREQEVARIRSLIEDLIRRLQEVLARQGRPLPPGIMPTPELTPTPTPTP